MLLGLSAGEGNFRVTVQIIHHRLYASGLLWAKRREISHSYIVVHPKTDKQVAGTYSRSLIKDFKIRQFQKGGGGREKKNYKRIVSSTSF